MEKNGERPDRRPASELRLILKNGSLWKGANYKRGLNPSLRFPCEGIRARRRTQFPPHLRITADVHRNRKVVGACGAGAVPMWHRGKIQNLGTLQKVRSRHSGCAFAPVIFRDCQRREWLHGAAQLRGTTMRSAAGKVCLSLTFLVTGSSFASLARAQQEEVCGAARAADGQRLSLARTHHIIQGDAQRARQRTRLRGFGMPTVLMAS